MAGVPDIQPQIFTGAASVMGVVFPGLSCTDEDVVPQSVPGMALVEKENKPYPLTADSESRENHIWVAYEASLYAANNQDARCMVLALNEFFNKLGFTRTESDGTYDRELDAVKMTLRYEALLDGNLNTWAVPYEQKQ